MRELILYLLGYGFSVSGNWLRYTAIGWVIKENLALGADMFAVYAGIVAVAQMCINPSAANVIRKKSRRSVLLMGNVILCIVTFFLSLCCMSGLINFSLLLMFGMVLSCANAFMIPAEDYFLMELVPPSHLSNANHARDLIMLLARSIFGVVGGLLIIWFGAGALFLFDAASFLVMWLCMLRISEKATTTIDIKKEKSMCNPFPMLRYILRDSTARLVCIIRYILDTFVFISWYLLPTIVKDELGGTGWEYGLVVGLSGIGGILSLLLTWRIKPIRLLGSILFLVFLFTMPLGLIIVGSSSSITLVVIGYALAIFASAPVVISSRQYLQNCSDPAYGLGAFQLSWTLGIVSIWFITSITANFEIKASTLLICSCLLACGLIILTLVFRIKDTRLMFDNLFWNGFKKAV